MIRRYMLFFGPLSSLFDFGTFAIMLWGVHASDSLFQTAWFVESLATQSLVIFVIRTRRTPFFRSRPSIGLLASVFGLVLLGAVVPYTPLAADLGFVPLPGAVMAMIGGLVVVYLVLVELTKGPFFRRFALAPAPAQPAQPAGEPAAAHLRRIRRRASRFSTRHLRALPRGRMARWVEGVLRHSPS
jgi:Mg2+-importing ATPase